MSLQEYGIDAPEQSSGTYYTTCPICSPNRQKKNDKCLTVYYDQGNEGQFKCHHCESFGYVDSGWKHINEQYEGGTSQQVQTKNKTEYNRDINLPEPTANQKLYAKVSDYFAERGISWDVATENNISWGMHYFPQTECELPAIMFPYYKDGELVNIKYRGKDPKSHKKVYTQVKNAEKTVFGYDQIKGKRTFIITEGEFDKLAFETAGFSNACSCPDGAPKPDAKSFSSKFNFLKSIEEIVKFASKIYLATDGDAPGQKLEEELSRRIGKHKCLRIKYPDDCKDANEVLVKHGKEAVADLIANAKPFPIDGVYNVFDYHEDSMRLYETGFTPGSETGYPSLKGKYNVKPGQVTAISGLPGSGKSVLFKNVAVNLARDSNWKIAVFDPENTPPERFVAEMSMLVTGKPFDPNRNGRMTMAEFVSAESFLNDHFHIIHEEDYEMPTLDDVLDKARQLVYREGIDLLMIDPFNNLKLDRSDKARDEYLNDELKKVMAFARQTKVHVFIVTHPNALKSRGKEKRIKPTPYDLNGGSAWYNTVDNMIMVHREDLQDNKVDVYVEKVRFQECGYAGAKTYLTFDKGNHTYKDPERGTAMAHIPPHPADTDDEAPF